MQNKKNIFLRKEEDKKIFFNWNLTVQPSYLSARNWKQFKSNSTNTSKHQTQFISFILLLSYFTLIKTYQNQFNLIRLNDWINLLLKDIYKMNKNWEFLCRNKRKWTQRGWIRDLNCYFQRISLIKEEERKEKDEFN
jgi:hypothetical protein